MEYKIKTNIVTSSHLQAEGHVEDDWTMSVHTWLTVLQKHTILEQVIDTLWSAVKQSQMHRANIVLFVLTLTTKPLKLTKVDILHTVKCQLCHQKHGWE